MNIVSWLQPLLQHRRAAASRRRRMSLSLAREVAVLERRALLAAVTDAGESLNIDLAAKEELSLSTDGISYSFVSDRENITNGGTTEAPSFSGFGTMSLTLNDLSKYKSINITANGANSRVRFADSGINTYVHDINIDLPDFGHIDFEGETHFGNSHLTANIDRRLSFVEDAIVTTQNGDVSLTAWFIRAASNVSITTTGTGDLSFFAREGVYLTDARTSSTVTGSDAGTVTLSASRYQVRTGHLSSVDGDIFVEGVSEYGGNLTGVLVNRIESTGTGPHAAKISVVGKAPRGTTGRPGVTLGTVTTIDGDVSITGTGNTGGEGNHGIGGGRVSAAGSGAVFLQGTAVAGDGVSGVDVSTVDGNIEIVGTVGGIDDPLVKNNGVHEVTANSTNGTLTIRGETSDFGGHGISISGQLNARHIELQSDTILLAPNRPSSTLDENFRIDSGVLTVATGSTTTGDLTLAAGAAIEFQTGLSNSDFEARLTTTGDLILESGAILSLRSQAFWVPVAGAELVLVERTGGSGAFAGLAEGAILPDFFNAKISYVGGDGNDIVLTLPQELPAASSKNIDLGKIQHSIMTVNGIENRDDTGFPVVGAGDVNNDGYDDFLVATGTRNRTHLVFGKAELPTRLNLNEDVDETNPEFVTIDYGRAGVDDFQDSITAADINNDGYSDIIMRGTERANVGSEDQHFAEVVVIYGAASLPEQIYIHNVESEGVKILQLGDNDLIGTAVSAIGDVNDDGFEDIAIGAPGSDSIDNARKDAGAVHIVFGGASLPERLQLTDPGDAAITISGAQAGDGLGSAISGLGDVNGDGIDDFIVGAGNADGPNNSKADVGESYVLFGGSALSGDIDLAVAGSADLIIYGVDAGDLSGWSLGGGGDVNGDGLNDILIGAPFARGVQHVSAATGESYLILGSRNFGGTIDLANPGAGTSVMYGADRGDYSGYALDIVGDLNQDGLDDILIGAPGANSPVDALQPDNGELSILLGRNSRDSEMNFGVRGTVDVNLFGPNLYQNPGYSLSDAGDVDGDGRSDLVIGGGARSQQAYLISGSRLFSGDGKSFIASAFGENPHQPTIRWTFALNAASYELWVGLIGNPGSNPVIHETSNSLFYDTAANDVTLGIGRYRAWIRAIATDGSKSEWTNETFTVTTRPELQEIPDFDGVDRRPTITWDAVPGALEYRVFVTNTTTKQPGLIDATVEGTSYRLETELDFGVHRVWVQPIGPGMFRGQWS